MNRITFDKPKPISEIKEQYDISKVSVLTTPNIYPLIKGIEFSENLSFVLAKRKAFPIKRKMDSHIEAYQNSMLRHWKEAKGKIKTLINKVKEINKLDYNNQLTVIRIAKIPSKYKNQFIDVADKYDLNLSILDGIVLNPSLMVNARYDSRHNVMEFNPDYLEQHGMIRIGESGELISETDKTFIHEFGHAYWYDSLTEEDRMAWSGFATFLERQQLTGDMSQYLVGEKKRFDGSTMYSEYYTLRDEPFVSVYARFNIREDWAECFLYYKVAPKTLERINPKKYAFIKDKIGNKIEKENLTKAFAPEIDDPRELRDKIITILDDLKDNLSNEAKDAYQVVYNLGRQKGTYYLGGLYNNKLTTEDREKLQQLLERNDEYLDGFIDDVIEEHDNTLFMLAPTGMIEGVREYDDIDEFDQEFENAMDTHEHRLGNFAMAGLGVALMAGLTQEVGESMPGGYWHTSEDDRVCDGCDKLDGQWMTYDEFWQLYQHNECNIGCRCEELFEPAHAPGDYEGINIYGTPADEIDMSLPGLPMERMIKAAKRKKRKQRKFAAKKICAVDYHNTIQYIYMIDASQYINYEGISKNPKLRDKLQQLKKQKYHIIIHFGGVKHSAGAINEIMEFLKHEKIPYDEIWNKEGKPEADIYFENIMMRPSDFSNVNTEPTKETKIITKGGPGSGRYPAGSGGEKEQAKSEYLYHVTHTDKLEDIKKKGILPIQISNWVEAGSKERYGGGQIYAFNNLNDAARWAGKMDWEFNKDMGSGKISIVRFKNTGDWKIDENDPLSQAGREGDWLKKPAGVKADDIDVAVPFTTEHTKRLVAEGDVGDIFTSNKMVKGGPGSGRYPAGSSTKLTQQEQKDYDRLSMPSKLDYMDHRRAGMEHQPAFALAEPDKSYVKKTEKTVAVDYHGTLMVNDKVNETIKTKLQEMKDEGYHIIIYTSGITHSPGAFNGIQTWLQQNEIPFDEVWQKQGKPDADIYFEDKAVRPSEIEGKTLEEIENLPKQEDDLIGG